jgi:hypothetical protein
MRTKRAGSSFGSLSQSQLKQVSTEITLSIRLLGAVLRLICCPKEQISSFGKAVNANLVFQCFPWLLTE